MTASADMSIAPPFLYERPPSFRFDSQSSERGFNPRAATDATWAEAQRIKEKRRSEAAREGPLIDKNQLNKHPDSYMVIPSGYLDFKPFSNRRKNAIIWTRWVQLGLRIISLIGSIGLLICLIFIKTTGEQVDWILRIPPGVAIIHSFYATWNLSKRAGSRTPASSASYFIFACIFDAGLIPFMIYTTLNVYNEWLLAVDQIDGHWTTLFGDGNEWPQITLYSTWLTSATLGGIWVVTFIMCFYLATQFRKIACLPPDMNPFEENLTSRSSSKHKKSKSTITQVTETESNRDSIAALLQEKGPQVPWAHTRNGSTTSLGSNSPSRSPRHSRYESTDSLTPPRSPYRPHSTGDKSARNSTTSVNTTHRRQGHARTDSNGDVIPPTSPSRQSARSSPRNAPSRSSALRPAQDRSNHDSPSRLSVYQDAGALPGSPNFQVHGESPRLDDEWPLPSPSTTPKLGGPSGDAWMSPRSVNTETELIPKPLDTTPPEFRHLRADNIPHAAHKLPSQQPAQSGSADRPYAARSGSKYDYSSASPKPLGMNPPTPPVDASAAAASADNALRRNAYRSNRANRAGTREALRDSASGDVGNRGYASLQANDEDEFENAGNWAEEVRGSFLGAADGEGYAPLPQSRWTAAGQKGQRVVSSGYEEQGLNVRQGAVRERQVSGKMVEEGRGGLQALRAEMGWA